MVVTDSFLYFGVCLLCVCINKFKYTDTYAPTYSFYASETWLDLALHFLIAIEKASRPRARKPALQSYLLRVSIVVPFFV